MKSFTLTEAELAILRAALKLARDRYLDHATLMRRLPQHVRVTEQIDHFDWKAEETARMIDKLNGAPDSSRKRK